MRSNLLDASVLIAYRPGSRNIGAIYFTGEPYVTSAHPIGLTETLFFCPWCGTKLPSSLRDECFDAVERESDELDEELAAKGIELDLPELFKARSIRLKKYDTEEWWKERGL